MINSGTPIVEEIDGIRKNRTILRKLLEDGVNGDKIVEKELDIHVSELCDNKNSVDYALEVDFEGILYKD